MARQTKNVKRTSKSVAVTMTVEYLLIWQTVRKIDTEATMLLEVKMAIIILFCLLGSLRLQSMRRGRTISIIMDKQSPVRGS